MINNVSVTIKKAELLDRLMKVFYRNIHGEICWSLIEDTPLNLEDAELAKELEAIYYGEKSA